MKNLKEARKYCGFSQTKVALLVNISQQTYSDYENNKTFPDENTLIKIADCLGVSVDYLLGREDDFGNVVIQSTSPASDLTKEEQEVLDTFRAIPDNTKGVALTMLHSLSNGEKRKN